jgi:hypothetical protein
MAPTSLAIGPLLLCVAPEAIPTILKVLNFFF